MGNPCLYLYPLDGDGTAGSLERIEWPSGIGQAELEVVHLRSRQEARSPAGAPGFVQYGAFLQLSLRIAGLTRGSHEDFLNRLEAADSQLSMGATAHFCRDRSKAGVWPVTDAAGTAWDVPSQGDTTVYYDNPSELLGIDTTPAVAAADDIIVETEVPECHRSQHRLTARTTSSLTLAYGVLFKSAASKSIFYWEGMYPALRLADANVNQPRLRRTGAMQYEWNAVFQSCPADLFDLITGAGP